MAPLALSQHFLAPSCPKPHVPLKRTGPAAPWPMRAILALASQSAGGVTILAWSCAAVVFVPINSAVNKSIRFLPSASLDYNNRPWLIKR